MLVYLTEVLIDQISGLNLFNYITFRAGGATLTSLFFSLIFGNQIIKKLKSIQPHGQPIRPDGPKEHIIKKSGTPTMGGILILSSILFSVLIWADLNNAFIWIILFVFLSFGGLGFIDDYLKISSNVSTGLSPYIRITLQILIAFFVVLAIKKILPQEYGTILTFPFLKNFFIDLGIFFIPFGIFIIIGSSNAVNLTDGLDGLAIVPVMIAGFSFAIISYVVGNLIFSNYLQIQHIAGCGELSIICGALVGASLGFLWFNAPPAMVFMGDTGSLPLGGLLACIAEEHRDDNGLIWPVSVAPYEVHLVALAKGGKGATAEAAGTIFEELTEAGIEVLYDDRTENPGVKFNDADLIGVPLRITVGERSLKQGEVELKGRADESPVGVPVAKVADDVKERLAALWNELS